MEENAFSRESWEYIQKNFTSSEDVYLDHAGTTLYAKSSIEKVFAELTSNVFGNPHSHSPSSKHTSDLIDQIRFSVLKFFNADPTEYSVIFTSGTTHGCKIVAESFIFHEPTNNVRGSCDSGTFVYIKESHTSAVGMREYFKYQVPCIALPTDELLASLEKTDCEADKTTEKNEGTGSKLDNLQNHSLTTHENNLKNGKIACLKKFPNSLFVFPAQCNFSGFKYPLELIAAIQSGKVSVDRDQFCLNPETLKWKSETSNWFCLLDAASFVGTNHLDLSVWKPDMVVISFYKIFGYPTGLGALIINQRASQVLKKKYFGGGTVEMFSPSKDKYVPREIIHERFEDGTANFLSIIALRTAILEHKKMVVSMKNVSNHTFFLAQYLYQMLYNLKHPNGKQLVEVYSPTDFSDPDRQGGIVTFNLREENGDYVGYSQVDKVLALFGIHVRTGCFCNPGACQRYLKLTDEEVLSQYSSGHKCGDENDLIDGKPTGAVRVSFGLMSKKRDVDKLVEVLRDSFLHETKKIECSLLSNQAGKEYSTPLLVGIHVFPIKSCGAFSPSSWPLTKAGLLYDRQWVIVNEAGAAITQKRESKLCLIKPKIDLSKNLLVLTYEGTSSTVSIPLEPERLATSPALPDTETCFTKVCGKVLAVQECDAKVSEWLGTVLERPGLKLLRYDKTREGKVASFANEAPFLLVNRSSVLSLQEKVGSSMPDSQTDCFMMRFRGNFIIDGLNPFEEETSQLVRIGSLMFKNVGSCYRCQMICIDQSTASRSQKPMTALADYRGKKMPFGIQLELNSIIGKDYATVRVNSAIELQPIHAQREP